MEPNEIINKYINGAEIHGKGTQKGDYETTNFGYWQLNDAYKILKEKDPELSALIPLLKHENISVRSWAAAHLLMVNSEVALPILEEISKEKGIFAFDAKMVIKQWKEGKLRF